MGYPVLLVWEEVPESTKLYVFEETSDMAKWALASVGKYINQDDLEDDHPLHQLSENLGQFDELPHDKVAVGPFSKVVVCGFVM